MSDGSRILGWCLLAVWGAWLFALQGLCASSASLGPWTPEVGIVLCLALEPRMTRRELLPTVLLVSAARVAFSSEPPLAILVGYGFLIGFARALRRVVEIEEPLPRAALAALGVFALDAYWGLARSLSLAATGGAAVPALPTTESLPLQRILVTTLATLVLSPWIVRLPGLRLIVARARGLA